MTWNKKYPGETDPDCSTCARSKELDNKADVNAHDYACENCYIGALSRVRAKATLRQDNKLDRCPSRFECKGAIENRIEYVYMRVKQDINAICDELASSVDPHEVDYLRKRQEQILDDTQFMLQAYRNRGVEKSKEAVYTIPNVVRDRAAELQERINEAKNCANNLLDSKRNLPVTIPEWCTSSRAVNAFFNAAQELIDLIESIQ